MARHWLDEQRVCDTDGTNCMVITSGPPDDTIPELQTNPSAGGTGEGESSD